MADISRFSEKELMALSINAMGRSSEASSLPVMKLGMAGISRNGSFTSVVLNSGYTLGFFQYDFGVGKDASRGRSLLEAYNSWAKPSDRIQNMESVSTSLHTRGQSLVGKADLREGDIGKKLQTFLSSNAGYAYNLGLQEKHFNEELKPAITKSLNSRALANKSADDSRVMLAVLGKLKNQTGSIHPEVRGLLENPSTSPKNLVDKVHTLYPLDSKWKSISEGVDATVRGAELFNKLSNDQGRMGNIFRSQIDLDPTLVKSGFQTHAEPQILDAMFRNPEEGKKLIDAVNAGHGFQIDNHAGKIRDEAYTVGVTADGKLYSADKTGHGFYADRSGHWHTLNQLQDIGVQFKTQARKDRAEVDMPTPMLAESQTNQRPEMSPQESKLLTRAYECLSADHNQGRFDRFDAKEQENIAGAAVRGAMSIAGNPRLNIQDFNHIFLSENGNMYIGMGKRDMPVNAINIAEASQTPLTQSLDISRHDTQNLLAQQQDLARSQGGPSLS